MNPWGQSVRSVNQSLGTAVDAMGDLITCFNRDIDGNDNIANNTQRQLNSSLVELRNSLEQLAATISGVADAQNQATLAFLAGKKLNREQFYILLATECVAWTNKNVGLSDFEDFELFDLLRYETNEQSGYIYLAPDIDNLPYTDPDDWTLNFLSRAYRQAIIAPESIRWSTLSRRQRAFFHIYLPGAIRRFIHDVPVAVPPAPEIKDPVSQAPSGATARVKMRELVAALRSLKVHLKARRKLDLLIRNGDREGQLVLELSGRSQYAGFLTIINCVGSWTTETLAPAASFRGFVAHPPADETSDLLFRDGRLHIGAWSCPARAVEAW